MAFANKAVKTTSVRSKAVARRGVVMMSAATDEIVEKMKSLTVSAFLCDAGTTKKNSACALGGSWGKTADGKTCWAVVTAVPAMLW